MNGKVFFAKFAEHLPMTASEKVGYENIGNYLKRSISQN